MDFEKIVKFLGSTKGSFEFGDHDYEGRPVCTVVCSHQPPLPTWVQIKLGRGPDRSRVWS